MRNILGTLAVAIFFLLLPRVSLARHIIGGNITYRCLGEGDYEFTLTVYRDCNCTGCATLDEQGFIAIYRCGGSTNCSALSQRDFIARLNVPLGSRNNVDQPKYPCLIPPNICVERGVYTFTLSRYNIRLPLSEDSYHISYQRCCRNVTINNIVAPGDVGSTYTIEITPEAQRKCNNSPTFNQFPPTVICADAPLMFDHSAKDPDGDQLVYSFCAPLTGGGPATQNALVSGSCSGAYPNPACPPPYGNVTFIQPLYTPVAPMGGNPIVRIDPNTGLITGTPRIQGQFVVGVCVEEFDKITGKLLSKVFRDFQFNVAACDPTVVADIKENRVIKDKEFLVNSCGKTDIKFVNESYQRQYINTFEWTFNIAGQKVVSKDWEPTITFPGVGTYNGTLVLNPNTSCGDTARIFVQIFPDITADFDYVYDTCVAGPVSFTDKSSTRSVLTNWAWKFGDGATGSGKNTAHTYKKPGNIPVTLTVRDTNECTAEKTRDIPYFPVPALLVIAPSSFKGCAPADIFFQNLSFPVDETYKVRWKFGDGKEGSQISPTHRYEKPGTYTVDLELVSPIGCKTDTTFRSLITVFEGPEADFTYAPEELSNLNPKAQFTDQSQRAIRWFWDFGDGTTSRDVSPAHTFADTGTYQVALVVTHRSGCTDTLVQTLDVKPLVSYFLPNAFTPNEDAVNDTFKGTGILAGIRNFSFQIWNRWGGLVFSTDNPDAEWNGRNLNSGEEAPPGVYVVLVTFTSPRGEAYEYKGFVTLIR